MSTTLKPDAYQRVSTMTLVLLAASLGLNLMLGTMLVRSVGAAVLPERSGTAPGPLTHGDGVPALVGRGIDGTPVRIEYASSALPTLIYVVRPSCVWCQRNEANFAAIVNERGTEYRIIVASLADDGFSKYLDGLRPAWGAKRVEALMGLDGDVTSAMRLGGTPQTLVISPQGKVERNWLGAYEGSRQAEVAAYFKVTLPGLSAASSK